MREKAPSPPEPEVPTAAAVPTDLDAGGPTQGGAVVSAIYPPGRAGEASGPGSTGVAPLAKLAAEQRPSDGRHRPVWPAYLGIGAAALGAVALVALAKRLRRGSPSAEGARAKPRSGARTPS